jgi:hypothetical protein
LSNTVYSRTRDVGDPQALYLLANPSEFQTLPGRDKYQEAIEFWRTIPPSWNKAVEAAAKIEPRNAEEKRREAMNAVLENLKL